MKPITINNSSATSLFFMQIKKFAEAIFIVLALGLTACSTIYVADVPFSSVEICSEELASRLHPDTGCIPATRAQNARGAFVGRYRLYINEDEWGNIASSVSAASGISQTNILQSWIGRAISQDRLENIGWKLFPTPHKNSFDVLQGASSVSRALAIPTVVSFPSDLSGIIHKRLNANAEMNAAAIAKSALALAGIPPSPSLQNALAGKVLALGYISDSISSGKGNYYYVSMQASQLDSLTTALAICSNLNNRGKKCYEKLGGEGIDQSVFDIIKDAEEVGERIGLTNVGIIIGVAVLRTQGATEICTEKDIGLVAGGVKDKNKFSQNCQILRNALDTEDLSAAASGIAATYAANGASGVAAASSVPSASDIKDNLLVSVQAAYSKESDKRLRIDPRTTVLALHWVPLAISGGVGTSTQSKR